MPSADESAQMSSLGTAIDAISALYADTDQPDEGIQSYLDSMSEAHTLTTTCMTRFVQNDSHVSECYQKLSLNLKKALEKLREAFTLICERTKSKE